jgi:hypothetical protein
MAVSDKVTDVRRYVRHEIEAIETTYDNTRLEAATFVAELLASGDYSDALSDRQTITAIDEAAKQIAIAKGGA